MFFARTIGDNQRRTRIGFRFLDSFHRLVQLGAQGNLRHIHMSVHHHTDAQIFASLALAMLPKLGNRPERRGFRRLSARVGVTLGIQYQNIDVLGETQDVIQPAKTNIVSPAVAANQPDGLLNQRISIG